MKKENIKKIVVALCIALIVGSFIFMFGGNIGSGSGIKTVTNGDMTMPEANAITDEVKKNTIVEQKFKYSPDTISEVAIVFTRKYYLEDVKIKIELLDGNKVLASNSYKVAELEDQHRTYLKPDKKITGVAGKELTLRIIPESKIDTGMAIMMQENKKSSFKFGNKEIQGTLCFSISE